MNTVRVAGFVAAALALGAGVVVARHTESASPAEPSYDVAAERTRRDADIAFYHARIATDPTGALDELRLGALYLQRARERGAPQDLSLAETAARRSLANRRAHNDEAWRVLALSLVGQHRFAEAAAAADSLLAADPTAPGARSLRGEIFLELGRYTEADRVFTALDRPGTDPAVLARVARWASLRGRAAHARALLIAARNEARGRAGTPAEQIAWYDLRLGELALTTGHFPEATSHLEHASAIVRDDPRILLAQARLALAQGAPKSAVVCAEAAMNAGEDPLAFALASEAHRRLGEEADAAEMLRAFETAIGAAPPSAWHRQWRLALLDAGRRIPEVLAQAKAELTTRRDVYGWDLYAWALHRAGRDTEARLAIRHALAWRTEDTMLWAHAAELGVNR